MASSPNPRRSPCREAAIAEGRQLSKGRPPTDPSCGSEKRPFEREMAKVWRNSRVQLGRQAGCQRPLALLVYPDPIALRPAVRRFAPFIDVEGDAVLSEALGQAKVTQPCTNDDDMDSPTGHAKPGPYFDASLRFLVSPSRRKTL